MTNDSKIWTSRPDALAASDEHMSESNRKKTTSVQHISRRRTVYDRLVALERVLLFRAINAENNLDTRMCFSSVPPSSLGPPASWEDSCRVGDCFLGRSDGFLM